MYGGINPEEREKVKAAFQANPEVSTVGILLATDTASEGLDLQNYCSNLIHYEIPWNPNRMEQRNGRLDRHGQKAQAVKIYHFVGKNYDKTNTQGIAPDGRYKPPNSIRGTRPCELDGDLEFLMRAALKVNNIREDLGKVGSVIADQVEEAMLGKRTILDTEQAEEQGVAVRKMFKFERQINDRIAQLKEHLDETRTTLRLEPQNIETVVKIGLELAEQQPLQLKLDLFNDAEQQQLESNRNSLKARLEDIPQEIEQETKLIKDRFGNLSSRLFPLAIGFLVPQKYA